MAIFGCTQPRAHDTLPRKTRRDLRPVLAQVSINNGAGRVAPAQPPQSENGGPGLPVSPLARSMSRRNGNGAKLQKRTRVIKTMIGAPKDFEHVSHVNKDEALTSEEMAEVVQALKMQPISTAALPSSETMIITMPSTKHKDTTSTPRDSQDEQVRPSLDVPGRKPTINKRKAPPPVTASIIKAAGLPPSLATNASISPLLPASPVKTTQNLRGTPLKLKAKRQSRVNAVHETSEALPTADQSPDNNNSDGLGGLASAIPSENLLTAPELGNTTSSASQPANTGPARSTTLQNLALSQSMEDMVKHAEDMREQQEDSADALQPPRPVAVSPSGPLAYMTDSTKVRWDNGMAEIARQLKEQNLGPGA